MLQLCLLISRSYVNITKYCFNHLISDVREFFEVWNTMVHTRMPQKSAEWILRRFFIFVIFFGRFWIFAFSFGPPMARYQLTWLTVIKYSTIEIKLFTSSPCNLWRVAKIGLKSSKLGKKSQKLKISHKSILHLSEASFHGPWCFIPQKNTRTSLIEWWKGYSVIFTYSWEIS